MSESTILTIRYTIPVHTESEANLREHWAKKRKRTKEHRQVSGWAMYDHVREYPEILFLRTPRIITLTRVAPRMLDSHDNLPRALKAVVDGICDALGVKDNDSRLTWRYAQRKGDVRQYAVEVEIEAGL